MGAADRVERYRYDARPEPWPGAQSPTVNSSSRGGRLTGKFATESNLSLRAPAQVAADMDRPSTLFGQCSRRP
jgi:hypothetical protein